MSSQIEGTQATLTDLFDEEAGLTVTNTNDVEEVSNYLRAFRLVQDQMRRPDGLPISVRLLCDAHQLLLDGVRGAGKQPGELRRSQHWIGGTRPGNAVFVSPPPESVVDLLLIAALLENWGLLNKPLMYLSGYLKYHQAEYYRRLSAI